MDIVNKSKSRVRELQADIKVLEKDLFDVSQKQLHELLQSESVDISNVVGSDDEELGLLMYLVRNGYLDDNYHVYVSNFHEGRLTRNDRDYLLMVRGFGRPDPGHKIDTPKEICANLRPEDFGNKYVLNIDLIDYLLEDVVSNKVIINRAMRYLSENFDDADEFLSGYFSSGTRVDKFIRCLSDVWPSLISETVKSVYGAEIVSYVIKYVDHDHIVKNMNANNVLTDYLSENGMGMRWSDVLDGHYCILKELNVRFVDLPSLSMNDDMMDFVHANNLYSIDETNLNYILRRYSDLDESGTQNPETSNLTCIVNHGSDFIRQYMDENLEEYIVNVFLALPGNSKESGEVINAIINSDIADQLKSKVILKQDYVFESFDGVPSELWSTLVENRKVAVTWQNISTYLGNDDLDNAVLRTAFEDQEWVSPLFGNKMRVDDIGEEETKNLSWFVLRMADIPDSIYCELVKCIYYWYSAFPENVPHEKLLCLVGNRVVRLTEKTFSFAESKNDLVVGLIANNFKMYLDDKDKYHIDDVVRESLLACDLRDDDKLNIARDVSVSGVEASVKLSGLLSNLIVKNNFDCSKFDSNVLKAAILNAPTLSEAVELLLRCMHVWDEGDVMAVVAKLPEPYSEIATYGKRPKLENTELNMQFSKLLESRGFVSSIGIEGKKIRINTKK